MKKQKRQPFYLKNPNEYFQLFKNQFSSNHYAQTILKKKRTLMRSWKTKNSKLNYVTEGPEMAGEAQIFTE